MKPTRHAGPFHYSDFLDADAVDVKHELPLDYILACAYAFCVLDDCLAGLVVDVYEIGDITAGAFDEHSYRTAFKVCAAFAILGRDKLVRHLLAQVGDSPGLLPQLQLCGAVMLLSGGVCAYAPSAILITLAHGRLLSPGSVKEYIDILSLADRHNLYAFR